MAVFADPEGAAFCVWQAEGAQGRAGRQRARRAELQRPQHPRPRGREGVLRRGVRLGDARPRRRRPDVDAARATATTSSERSPGLRERMAEMGAPERFEDVVASVDPIPRRPGRHAGALERDVRRSTTPTRSPRRPTELGGRVVVPPFDAPWVRMTVIADPQGATFIASKFVPENSDLGRRRAERAPPSRRGEDARRLDRARWPAGRPPGTDGRPLGRAPRRRGLTRPRRGVRPRGRRGPLCRGSRPCSAQRTRAPARCASAFRHPGGRPRRTGAGAARWWRELGVVLVGDAGLLERRLQALRVRPRVFGSAHAAALADVQDEADAGIAQRAQELVRGEAVDADRRQPRDSITRLPAGSGCSPAAGVKSSG